jgi:hypothetical protein
MSGGSSGYQDDIVGEPVAKEEEKQLNRSDGTDSNGNGNGNATRQDENVETKTKTSNAPSPNPRPKPGIGMVRGILTKFGLDMPTVLAMFK